MLTAFLNPLAILMSFSTATGVLIHDMHIDAAATAAFTPPALSANLDASTKQIGLGGDAHTHVERSSLSRAITDLRTHHPRIQPRASEDKKYLLQKRVMRGHHAFDNYHLPIV